MASVVEECVARNGPKTSAKKRRRGKTKTPDVNEFEDTDTKEITANFASDGDDKVAPTESSFLPVIDPASSLEGAAMTKATTDSDSPGSNRRKKKKKKKKKGNKKMGILVSDFTGEETVAGPSKADLQMFANEKSLLEANSEEINILRIFKLLYGIGLPALRNVFMKIHPKWSNQPSDATFLAKGSMKLKSHELTSFNTGNIAKWDFSLITTVLLFSNVCAKEVKKLGYKATLHSLKQHKNMLLSHPTNDKMSDGDFESFWSGISKDLIAIDADAENINQILEDDVLQTGRFYREMFLQEYANESAVQAQVDRIEKKIDSMAKLAYPEQEPALPSSVGRDVSEPSWNDWVRFCESVREFNAAKNQYILITDAMSAEYLQHFSSLRNVSWKMVLDFDPSSERKGMYNDFSSKDGKDRLINMITPSEIRSHLTANLARQIDPSKTQWLFVNGRDDDSPADGGPQGLADWEASSVKQISKFFSFCSDPDKFDKHKPIICLMLPFRERNIPYLETTINRLLENFDEFPVQFVAVKPDFGPLPHTKVDFQTCNLPPSLLSSGLSEMFNVPSVQEYKIPTSQENLTANLKQNEYLFLKEYLDVMYIGCEDLLTPYGDELNEQQLKDELERHRESFLSGNWISFASLYDNHDARRELGNEVKNFLQRLLESNGPKHPSIVEIRHSPGTGGTTIARRVLWDLHKSYPCAIARLEDHYYEYEDDCIFINALADRISTLQGICHTTPVVLLDGKHMRIEVLTSRLARVLENRGQRAILLKCQHGSKLNVIDLPPDCSHVVKQFSVNVKLEESVTDLHEFQAKYKEYIEDFSNGSLAPRRVFHFPLMAMLEGFRPKLQQIIFETLDEMSPLEREIAVLVAFVQKYAGQATPAALLYKAFQQNFRQGRTNEGVTYEDINQLFTEHLLNLMVSAHPVRKHRTDRLNQQEDFPEMYTLQHPVVAELVLKKLLQDQKRDLFAVTRQFLKYSIFDDGRFWALMSDLFVRNKPNDSRKGTKFSLLFEELKDTNTERAAEIFREAAEKTNDAYVFTNAARFYARKLSPPSFPKAKDMIDRAFRARNAKSRTRMIYDTKGHILYCEMERKSNGKKIKSIEELQIAADEAIQAYKRARDFPPTFAYPLIGEVKVWLVCIEWIMKHECGGDSDETLKFISSKAPAFFRTCISDSFYLLDIVDNIVHSEVTLQHPEDTQIQANNVRLSLVKTFNKGKKGGRRAPESVVRTCKAICSEENFPHSTKSELKRLQAHFILSSTDQIETLPREQLEYLRKLLDDIVLVEGIGGMGYHLMKISVLFSGPQYYTLDKGLRIVDIWSKAFPYDPFPHYYQMVISFLQILDGNTFQYTAEFHKARKMCQERSVNHYRSVMSTHYLRNGGEGMYRLITYNTLRRNEDYENSVDIQRFWEVESRKKLRECSGRIRMHSRSGRKRAQPYIELTQGNVEVYVGKSADIGQVEKDFTAGSLVYFVVSFTLQGPVANGITFKPVLKE